jgi:hypothetical protein
MKPGCINAALMDMNFFRVLLMVVSASYHNTDLKNSQNICRRAFWGNLLNPEKLPDG